MENAPQVSQALTSSLPEDDITPLHGGPFRLVWPQLQLLHSWQPPEQLGQPAASSAGLNPDPSGPAHQACDLAAKLIEARLKRMSLLDQKPSN